MVLILLTIVSIGPVGLVVINSMKPHAMIVKNPLSFPTTIEIANFKTAWEAGNLAVGFKNSIFMTICSVIIAVFASFLAGYALSVSYTHLDVYKRQMLQRCLPVMM